ncbi:fumarylacetoacetate hydrolase family protein [Pseudonocardia kunmingensis]|uniref:2-keto-4-pentenoate hydratase/2-oxohepta-3-ene-1,7-dioic acid hydratase in catechol pathway n=1 Tax=Pseudonocardia kunmingensis TaxID=630975 RepID=A0A543DNV2_9PSEU|nr:fumarylacetoacetate hydrolase family protein [Pseudonocardia kunmingensis]TQM11012.1 2-keto-4-pentenoate hydratase/2-oxohepta-3-ene-1,7-dioic acid hydratase in catechol pathway [Pseudonocardia kunmingensis]
MRLATFGDDRIGVVHGDAVRDVSTLVDERGSGISRMRRLIEAWPALGSTAVSDAADRSSPARLADVELQPPVPDPTKIIAAPVNYADHQSEMNVDAHVSALGFFLKAPSSLLRPGGTIQLPYDDRRFDQEGELACIIGRRARSVSPAEALDHVFGYTGLMDITMRGGEDRSTRKSFQTFTPLGPWIVTADVFGAPGEVDLECWVSGEQRQKANTRDLIWDVAQLVSYASSVTTLHPGDVIATGTPAGVGPLAAGDTVVLNLSGLGGRLEVDVRADAAGPSPTTGKDRGPVPPPAR